MGKRGPKSKIDRLPEAVRERVLELVRDGQHTLTQIIDILRREYPDEDTPSVSGLHRFTSDFEQMMAESRQFDRAASIMVQELGSEVGERASGLLAQAVTTLAQRAAFQAAGDSETTLDDVRVLARLTKDVMAARRLSLQERKAVREEARLELLREQESRLETVAQAQGMDEEQAMFWRQKVLGIK